jgi:hypothetical protein
MNKKSNYLMFFFIFILSLLSLEIIYFNMNLSLKKSALRTKNSFIKLSKMSNLASAIKDNNIKLQK